MVPPTGSLVLPLSGTPFYSFLLFSSFLEDGNEYVILCVIQHEAGGLSKTLAIMLTQTVIGLSEVDFNPVRRKSYGFC